MKYTSSLFSSALLLVTSASAASADLAWWSTLTPNGAIPSGATTDFSGTFGISIKTVGKAPGAAPTEAPAAQQIRDGQIQHQTSISPVAQISDGQIQHQTSLTPAAQISDGQIQHQTSLTPAAQISDGQIQHQTTVPTPLAQISDGQVQHQTTIPAAVQISDGQIQHHTLVSGEVSEMEFLGNSNILPTSQRNSNSLAMTLQNSLLTDSHGRVGAIVANRQFQFDGPPPQHGTIYAAGWSINNGLLALGNQTEFYQSKSGDFYNLYDKPLSSQSEAVEFVVLQFTDN